MKLYSKPLVDLTPFSIPQATSTVIAAFHLPCGFGRESDPSMTVKIADKRVCFQGKGESLEGKL